ncbi:hypothetical protein [Paenibacillus montanisoli]|uniref:Uncharacterized protein n=1 Tax=Paenibacillus montanisoli TaxID=2081970 RepID=A0A328U4B8_9BACL|nr:hypothetical protein [Paenibacillus montanisoli]RAP74706.1 hypothetical protein DL346_21940 [Paenibacillus montanisoli]
MQAGGMEAGSGYGPIGISTVNPHYLHYKGSPILLITSAEHYGALINLDFDYVAYFDMLQRYEMNYTRIYPGAFYEVKGMFIEDNTLAPLPGRLVVPWVRSSEPGCADGGNKFDLSAWDERYFARLHDFLRQAEARGIVVEICLFNGQYEQSWPNHALFAANNIQGVGDCDLKEVQTLEHADLVAAHKAYVRKLVEEVNAFDNVILELCDEPTIGGTPAELTVKWIDELLDVIVETERELPKRHLVGQQLMKDVDYTDDPRNTMLVTQYISDPMYGQIGGVEALDDKYGSNKPIELNETGFYPIWYFDDRLGASRAEAWEFIVGGGAAFNQLNGLYTIHDPAGDTPENRQVLGSLRNLKRFMYGFDFERMSRDPDFIRGGIPEGARVRSISERGRQYALYLHHSTFNVGKDPVYRVQHGEHSAVLQLDVPAGTYRAEWVDPASGTVVASELYEHEGSGGLLAVASPVYKVDIALSVKRIEEER